VKNHQSVVAHFVLSFFILVLSVKFDQIQNMDNALAHYNQCKINDGNEHKK